MAGLSKQYVITKYEQDCCLGSNSFIALVRIPKDENIADLEKKFIENVVMKDEEFRNYTKWDERLVNGVHDPNHPNYWPDEKYRQLRWWYDGHYYDNGGVNSYHDYVREFLDWLKVEFGANFVEYKIEEYCIGSLNENEN